MSNSSRPSEHYQALVQHYLARRSNAEAMKECNEWIAAYPTEPLAHYCAGLTAIELDDLASAERHAKTLLELRPGMCLPYQLWAEVHFHAKRYQQALGFAMEVLAADPKNSHSYQVVAKIYVGLGELHEALRFMEKARELEPDSPTIQSLHAALFRQTREKLTVEADLAELNQLMQALALDPQNPQTLSRIGTVHLRLEDPIAASEFFAKSFVIDPMNKDVLRNLLDVRTQSDFTYRVISSSVRIFEGIVRLPWQSRGPDERIPLSYIIFFIIPAAVWTATLYPWLWPATQLYKYLIFADLWRRSLDWSLLRNFFQVIDSIPRVLRLTVVTVASAGIWTGLFWLTRINLLYGYAWLLGSLGVITLFLCWKASVPQRAKKRLEREAPVDAEVVPEDGQFTDADVIVAEVISPPTGRT